MFNGKYFYEGDTAVGEQSGEMNLKTDGEKLIGDLTILGVDAPVVNGVVEGNNATFQTVAKLPFASFEFICKMEADGDTITGAFKHRNIQIKFTGKKLD